jgi:UDP-N-acetylglucosamine 2-epimerase (non-hydrolysing)
MRILVPFGTRPEIVKLAPVIHALADAGHELHTVATGQHDDPMLSDAFLADLRVEPDARHELPTGDGARMGALVAHAYDDVHAAAPEVVVILGDTNTVPAYSLAARRYGVPVAHLEAGLRSFNARSLEEVNRRVGAATASLHLAPTTLAAGFLRDEGIPAERIRVVGNPITDVLRRLAPPPCSPAARAGVVVTAHRATNVDVPERLAALVSIVERLAAQHGPVRFPVHPRTRARLEAAGALSALERTAGLTLEQPLRYADMLDAVASARVVVTDSGGLQEEASWFGVPVVVLRTTTPRWEGVVAGTTRLTGLDVHLALDAVRELAAPDAQTRAAALPCPYGDGHVAARVVDALRDAGATGLLTLAEPPLGAGPHLAGPHVAADTTAAVGPAAARA